MSAEGLRKEFESLSKNVRALDKQQNIFERHFKANNIDVTADLGGVTTDRIVGDRELARAYINQTGPLILESKKLADLLSGYIKEYTRLWKVELAKKEDERNAERKYLWRLWGERLVRWTLGAFAAVLIYSCAVWASEHSEFIKVPIKDWLPVQVQDN